jgi:hypothetical protein
VQICGEDFDPKLLTYLEAIRQGIWEEMDAGTALAVHLSPMADANNDNHHSLPIDPVDHAIIANANPKVVRLRLEFLAARGKRIFAERGHFLGDPSLKLFVEVPELAGSRRREFKNIAHGR